MSGHLTAHSYPTDLQKLHPGRVLPASQPARAASDSERVTAMPTRCPPSISTDRPGTGSDRIWVRSFANTGLEQTVGFMNCVGYPYCAVCPREIAGRPGPPRAVLLVTLSGPLRSTNMWIIFRNCNRTDTNWAQIKLFPVTIKYCIQLRVDLHTLLGRTHH